MQPSIFNRPSLHKRSDTQPPSAAHQELITAQVKARLARVGQQLVDKRKPVSMITLLLTLALMWLTHTPEQSTPSKPTVSVLPIPLPSATSNTSLVAPIKSPPSVNIIEKPAVTHTNSSSLDHVNQQAIELARAGNAIQATNTLEAALIADPQAGPVFENLRRLYAGFASQSYQLALDPTKKQPVTVELSDAGQHYQVSLNAPTSRDNTPPAQTEIPVTSTPEPINDSVLTPPTNNINVAPITPVKTITTPPEPTPAQKEAAERKASSNAVIAAVKHWSDAWSQKDVKGYLASYAPNYAPKSSTRSAWISNRQERIQAPKFIKVEVSELKATLISPTRASITFVQKYSSDTLNARNHKTLELELINHTWLITSESGR